MANTSLKFGNGNWAIKEDSALAYSDQYDNFKPLPFDFSRAGSGTIVNKEGLIESVSSGLPRIDFSDSVDGALLLEPQRTNVIPYSEDFSQWYIDGNQSSPTIISELNPDGSSQVYQINLNSGGNIYRTISISSSIDYTFSVYIKGTGNGRLILSNPQSIPENYVDFTATSEWQRIELTGSSSSTSVRVAIGSWSNSSASGTIQIYGAQAEQGSYATSYIPTQGSASTRIAETCNNAGSAQDFNSEEGVLYAETSNVAKGLTSIISLTDGSNDERVMIYFANNLTLQFLIRVNEVYVAVITVPSNQINFEDTNKIAIKYKTNDMSFWLNGTEVATDTSGTMFSPNTLTQLGFNSGSGGTFYGNVKSVEVFTEALSDEELQKLTTI